MNTWEPVGYIVQDWSAQFLLKTVGASAWDVVFWSSSDSTVKEAVYREVKEEVKETVEALVEDALW